MNTYVEEALAESIAEVSPPQVGAAWLDREVPGWHDKIDLNTFDLRSSTQCVCGQVFAQAAAGAYSGNGYVYAVETFHGEDGLWSSRHGFCVRFPEHAAKRMQVAADEYDAAYDALEAEWREIIRARQAGEEIDYSDIVITKLALVTV